MSLERELVKRTLLYSLAPLFLLISGLTSANTKSPQVLSAYVLYAQNTDNSSTVNIARVVVNGVGSHCPALVSNTGDIAPVLKARINPDPVNFRITVCEALYTSTTGMNISDSDFTLPAVKKNPAKIIVLGDTGYKTSQLTPGTWKFPALATRAAKQNPDIVLHMGDYNYSGTPGNIEVNGGSVSVYDAGDNTTQGLCKIPGAYYGQNSPGSTSPDNWTDWQSNFFEPAKSLLAAAPWVFTRGNHELCSRAGPGWFYLLDSNSPLLGKYAAQLSCPATNNHDPIVLSPPYVVNLGTLNLAVLDSANACDSGLLNSEDYVNQFYLMRNLLNQAPDAGHTWLQSHRPFWGVDKLDSNGACGSDPANPYCYVNQTLQYADGKTALSKRLDLVVSGHMHRFQLVSFESGTHAQQLIVGNGGVELGKQHPKKTTKLIIDSEKATVLGVDKFGYMVLKLQKQGWTGKLFGEKKKLLKCDSAFYPVCK